MALKIRLRQQGRKNRQTYRLVLADTRFPRDGKYLEMLGSYNPYQVEGNVVVNAERLAHWLKLGAQPTQQVQALIAKTAPQVLKDFKDRIHAKRIKLAAKRRALKKKAAAPKAAAAKAPKKTAAKAPAKAKKAAKE